MDEAAKSEKTHILWLTNMDDDGYADVLFLEGEEPPYGVGINCGGHVIVKPLRDWHALASVPAQRAPNPTAWRACWVSLNTSRTQLFEIEADATAKARETDGCVIPLYSVPAQRAPMAADIAQIIKDTRLSGKPSIEIAEEILRELDASSLTSSDAPAAQGAPIETAPRDGTPILYWDEKCAIPETVCWLNGSRVVTHGWYPYAGGNWFVDAVREKGAVWWPLPKSPALTSCAEVRR